MPIAESVSNLVQHGPDGDCHGQRECFFRPGVVEERGGGEHQVPDEAQHGGGEEGEATQGAEVGQQ